MKPDPMQTLVERAGEEDSRCPRCDAFLTEGHACTYGIKASPLTGKELVVETDCPEAVRLLRSLGARHSLRYGYFLNPARIRFFEALIKDEAVHIRDRHYRMSDGRIRNIYDAARYMREKGSRVFV